MIKDSGERREFETGAVRDIQEGKGRCDLMPLDIIARIVDGRIVSTTEETDNVLYKIDMFKRSGVEGYLFSAIRTFIDFRSQFDNVYDAMLEVSVHFEEGAKKYGENNWQKGIPVHCYIDSAVRHYLKFLRGDNDERHDRAFLWNIICCIWTMQHHPELDDYTDKMQERKSETANRYSD